MEAGVMGSYAQMVADNEFAGSVLRVRNGIGADENALAVEVSPLQWGPPTVISWVKSIR